MQGLIKKVRHAYYKTFRDKLAYELLYWQECFIIDGGKFSNDFYARLMLSISDEADAGFLKDKVVADFGCGPRGSLIWAEGAKMKIGIDVLAQRYIENFPQEYLKQDMLYVTSTEHSIPIPDSFCDVVYSVNSLDHVQHLEPMCNELRRILKPGGEMIGSFNLNHKPDRAEPQTISEEMLKGMLFRDYQIRHWWASSASSVDSPYKPLYERQLIAPRQGEYYLWARGSKPL